MGPDTYVNPIQQAENEDLYHRASTNVVTHHSHSVFRGHHYLKARPQTVCLSGPESSILFLLAEDLHISCLTIRSTVVLGKVSLLNYLTL